MLRGSEGFDYIAEIDAANQDANYVLGAMGWYQFGGEFHTSSFTRFGYGRSITKGVSNSWTGTWVLPGAPQINPGIAGWAMYISDADEFYFPTVFLKNASNDQTKLSVTFLEYGRVRVNIGGMDLDVPGNGGGTPLGDVLFVSAPGSWFVNTWFYVEVRWVLDDDTVSPTGELELRINTVPLCQYTNITTSANSVLAIDAIGVATILFSEVGGTFFDDFYALDETGDQNNTFLGNVRAQGILPVAPGDSTTWSPFGALTNWEAARNTLVDDSKYVFTDDVGDLDLYEIDPIINSPSVFAVSVKGAYRQDDATQRFAQNVLKPTSTEFPGTPKALNSSYSFIVDIYEQNPDTDMQWTDAEVNGVQIGPKVES